MAMNPDIAVTNSLMLDLLSGAVDREASDVHLVPGYPAMYRIHGNMAVVNDKAIESSQLSLLIDSILPESMIDQTSRPMNMDFSLAFDHQGRRCRFRSNVFLAQGHWCACFRYVPDQIPSFDWMGFPNGLAQRLIDHRNGLVFITGVTGSGKSTTMAGLVDLINQKGGSRIITVEEPIEYVHKPMSSTVITQREVGRDVASFYEGLKSGLRQDPDVILLGEIRDRDTAQMALSAAETGHLILTTLHTKDAKGAVTRFVDLFPHETHDDVRTQLGLSLRSVVSQHLLPPLRAGDKRVLALEAMHVNHPVRIAIKFGKIESIESAIQTGRRDGMFTLDDDLQRLAGERKISMDTARRFAKDPQAIG